VTNFYHRYAMLALALAGERRFLPSLLEAPEIVRTAGQPASYTVDTLARMRARLTHGERLYCLVGMDAFEHIAKWRRAVDVLRSAEVIVASRPGFPLKNVVRALPEELRPDEAGAQKLWESGSLETHGAKLHLLEDVHEEVSATLVRKAIREAVRKAPRETAIREARRGAGLEKLVPPAVAEYIAKMKIYDEDEEAGAPEPPKI
jgi:nicotinate-nucleotide adenylyltransferase